jgi:TonB family protein
MPTSALFAGQNRARWSIGVVVSLAAHVAMFGGALMYARLTPPHTVAQRPIMAHLVRLGRPAPPKQLPRLPAPTRPPPPGATTPPTHSTEPTPPDDAVAISPKVAPKPDDESDDESSEKPLQRAKEALTRQQRLASALAKLGSPTEGPTSPKGEAPVGQTNGDAVGTAERAAEGERYAALVQEALKRNYVVPTTIPEKERLYLANELRIFIAADGKITNFKIEKPSGNELFDGAVKETLENTGTLPPPPPALAAAYSGAGLGVRFKP